MRWTLFAGLAVTAVVVYLLVHRTVHQLVVDCIARRQRAENQALYRDFARVVGPVHLVAAGDASATLVECARDARGEFATCARPELLDGLRAGPTPERIDALFTSLLPLVSLRGRRVAFDDVVVVDVLESRGAYFPSMHTDVEWNMYPTDGFQVWMLLENDDAAGVGNMFIFDTDVRSGGGARITYDERRGLQAELPDHRGRPQPARPLDIQQARYLDFRPGDCIVFGQNLVHMSDFRSHAAGRRAVNFRVLIRDENGRVPFRPFAGGASKVLGELPYRLLHAQSFYRRCGIRAMCPMHGVGL
tara:strand:+ start:2157 stop:3065 length:909 start_codon:yes stop_codon:yes gene_type:complete